MITYKAVEGRVVRKRWVCDAIAEDVESKIWAKGRHFQTAQSAIENAVNSLINKLKVAKILS